MNNLVYDNMTDIDFSKLISNKNHQNTCFVLRTPPTHTHMIDYIKFDEKVKVKGRC